MRFNPRVFLDLTAKQLVASVFSGAGGGNRTPDPLITNQMLYQLSYASADIPNLMIAQAEDSINGRLEKLFAAARSGPAPRQQAVSLLSIKRSPPSVNEGMVG